MLWGIWPLVFWVALAYGPGLYKRGRDTLFWLVWKWRNPKAYEQFKRERDGLERL